MEQALAAAHNHRVNHQLKLVHKLMFDQQLHQPGASDCPQILAILMLEPAHLFGDVAP
jgi:hypothetical protein